MHLIAHPLIVVADGDIRVRPDYLVKVVAPLAALMLRWELTKRRLREGIEFFRFLRMREAGATLSRA